MTRNVFKIYWVDTNTQKDCSAVEHDLSLALQLTQQLRTENHRFISMASEILDHVGALGVDFVQGGLLPDGTEYTWRKRRP